MRLRLLRSLVWISSIAGYFVDPARFFQSIFSEFFQYFHSAGGDVLFDGEVSHRGRMERE